MECDPTLPIQPATARPLLVIEEESVWKPDIIKDVKEAFEEPRKRKGDVINAMATERYLLIKDGQQELANFLYRKMDLIKKHVKQADEIIFDQEKGLDSVRAFIEERFIMHFGPDMDGSMRKWTEEEEEEQQFLIDNSLFILKVILRMNNLDPDDYKSEFGNFHAMAKSKIIFRQTEIRDKELDEMKRRLEMARIQAREDRLERIRDGEVSSDDDLYEEDGEVVDEERSAEYEQQLIAHMQKLHIEVEPDR
ncbi:hypothetical protein OSTOST_22997, partial [Ostertagia ostertagi]